MALNKTDSPATKRIFLVDDHSMVTYGLMQLIHKEKDLMVAGQAQSAAEALEQILALKPELVITDITLKESSGLELIKNLKSLLPQLPILVISMHSEMVFGETALRAGAMGYLMKEEAMDRVMVAIRSVLNGQIYVSEPLASKMLQIQLNYSDRPSRSPLDRLTSRELEIFQLLGQWKGTRQIAAELNLSVKTIEFYRDQIKKKLNLGSAAELLQYATSWIQKDLQP